MANQMSVDIQTFKHTSAQYKIKATKLMTGLKRYGLISLKYLRAKISNSIFSQHIFLFNFKHKHFTLLYTLKAFLKVHEGPSKRFSVCVF